MAQTLTRKTVEFSSGVTGALPLHEDGSNNDLYPIVQLVPTELGGLSVKSFLAAASNNATALKTSAGQLYGWSVFHVDAAPVYLKFYNLTTTPAPATDTPFLRFAVGLNNDDAADGSQGGEFWPMGIAFGTGIGYALVTGIAETNNSSLTATEVLVNIYYK